MPNVDWTYPLAFALGILTGAGLVGLVVGWMARDIWRRP